MTNEQTRVLSELRRGGHAVIVWTPDELGTADPRRVEDRSIELGYDVIEVLDGSEPGICHSCSGSGEGQFDGATCRVCNGKGEA